MREPEAGDAGTAILDRQANPTVGGLTVVLNDVRLRIPRWVVDLESFDQWSDSADFPEDAEIWWLCGEVWADMSMEQIFTHVDLKGAIFAVLYLLVKEQGLGKMLTDGARLRNPVADISGKPDGMYFSTSTLESDRLKLRRGAGGGFVVVEGPPDMVLEVVSDSSEDKDTVVLMDAYWKAGIPEYWLVDARGDQLRFDIFRHGAKGYKRSAKKHGWMASPVFGKSFRLTVRADKAGRPDYTLDVR